MKCKKILFVKPPDRYLEDEFVYQQLGPHYLQSFLAQCEIPSDILVLYERSTARENRLIGLVENPSISDLNMLYLDSDGRSLDESFDHAIFSNYDIIGMSVMSPQAPDAYMLVELINHTYPEITTVIGGSHPRYYRDQVESLPPPLAFDFIVPQDGWVPMFNIATGKVKKQEKSQVLIDNYPKLTDVPPPTRPLGLMGRYRFEIAGVPAYHTITALGCPFTCHFCESGIESVRMFSERMLDYDLSVIAKTQNALGHEKKSVMFFDDVGLMNPRQVSHLASLVEKHNFDTWRAFTHAYLVNKFGEKLLRPFLDTGGEENWYGAGNRFTILPRPDQQEKRTKTARLRALRIGQNSERTGHCRRCVYHDFPLGR